jgi:hypothetical protein
VSVKVQPTAACETVKVWFATVTVPLRGVAFGFAAMLNDAEPLPLPLAPAVTVIQPALLVDVHEQPVGEVTVVDPVVAPAPTDWPPGEIEYVQAAADCVIENVCPPMVSVPVRCVAFGFGAMSNDAEPLPLPLVEPWSVTHPALLVAVHAQPAGAVMLVDPGPPAAAIVCDPGDSEYVHGVPACVTVKMSSPIVTEPMRCAVLGFAATL